MKKYIINCAAVLSLGLIGLGAASCSQEELEGTPEAKGVEVPVTMTVNVDDEALSRTTLSENEGNLKWKWEEGSDAVLITDATGSRRGSLKVKKVDASNPAQAELEGTIIYEGKTDETLNFFYLGKGVSTLKEGSYTVDMSLQSGELAELPTRDVLWAQKDVKLNPNYNAIGDISLTHYFAAARFEMRFPSGVTATPSDVTIGGNGVYAGSRINLATLGTTASAGTIMVTDKADFYINLIPAANVKMEFTVVDTEGKEWKGTYAGRSGEGFTVNPGRYYRRNADFGGLIVELKGDEPDDKGNPGNTDNWGTDATDPSYDRMYSEPQFVGYDGWCNNSWDVDHRGGFAKFVRYNSNGMINGHMTSKGGTSLFFQWGRWLGFPSSVNHLEINGYGSYSGDYNDPAQMPLGIDYYNDLLIGYTFQEDNALSAAHGCVYANWTKQQAINNSYMFGMVSSFANVLDYVSANEVTTWEGRSGNPAPAGYRIPKKAELEALIPAGGTFTSKHAEVKTIDGIKYAMQWKLNGKIVEIRSFRTNSSSVSVDDPAFDEKTPVRFFAWGYLNNECERSENGTMGVYWSSESATLDDGSNGAWYLEVDFNGSGNVEMGMGKADRCFGALVLLIKDDTATPSPIEPYVPLQGLRENPY